MQRFVLFYSLNRDQLRDDLLTRRFTLLTKSPLFHSNCVIIVFRNAPSSPHQLPHYHDSGSQLSRRISIWLLVLSIGSLLRSVVLLLRLHSTSGAQPQLHVKKKKRKKEKRMKESKAFVFLSSSLSFLSDTKKRSTRKRTRNSRTEQQKNKVRVCLLFLLI